jgi:hypothetical protein
MATETGGMSVVLLERNASARSALAELLRALGVGSVSSFADLHEAFAFLRGSAHAVDGVVLNGDDERASGLLRRLEALPASPAVVTYSGRTLEQAAKTSIRSGTMRCAGVLVSRILQTLPGGGSRHTWEGSS